MKSKLYLIFLTMVFVCTISFTAYGATASESAIEDTLSKTGKYIGTSYFTEEETVSDIKVYKMVAETFLDLNPSMESVPYDVFTNMAGKMFVNVPDMKNLSFYDEKSNSFSLLWISKPETQKLVLDESLPHGDQHVLFAHWSNMDYTSSSHEFADGSSVMLTANVNGDGTLQLVSFVAYEGDSYGVKHSYETYNTPATLTKDGSKNGICTVCGEEETLGIIRHPASMTLSRTSYVYDGKVKSPALTVKDSKGKTISSKYYSVGKSIGRKNVGSYTYTINFKDLYSGTKKLTFKINPKATSLTSVTATSKGFKMTWAKRSIQTTGYQLQYSTSGKFTSAKTITVSSYKTTSKTVSKLTGNKKYYVRVRCYKTVSGTKYYSDWSAAKAITTKK